MADSPIVGTLVPPVHGKVKATGEAKFTVNIQVPGMLYGNTLRISYPHAKILNIDAEKTKRLRGVKAFTTGMDIPRLILGFSRIVPKPMINIVSIRDGFSYL